MHKSARGPRTERLTDNAVARIPLALDGQHVVRDALCPGLFVVVGKRAKTWTVQGDLRRGSERQTIKMALGRTDEIDVAEARRLAADVLDRIRRGEDPRGGAATGALTLRAAMEAYCKTMMRRGRCDRSIDGVRDGVERVLKAWVDEPLVNLGKDRRRVVQRHDELTERHGPYAANGAMRILRAIYNHAMKLDPELPPNPVRAVTFNAETRRDTGMGAADLPAWEAQRVALGNPIRREFHLVTLLTGSRPEALRLARWEHIDVARRVLRIPSPKGGAKRAFDIPLSRPLIRSLVRVRRVGLVLYPRQASEWIFPAASASGHVAEHKEHREDLSKWGNDLRQTFRNMCALAGIDPLSSRLLMNHQVSRDVHDGYLTKSALMDSLRAAQERVSTAIMAGLAAPVPKRRETESKTADPAPARAARTERKPSPRVARATAKLRPRKTADRTGEVEARA